MRICESEDTAEMMLGFEGWKAVLYVHEPMGRVRSES
ncbi:hypothetical protein VDGD_05304 [Verticillium dahliae]|nr:hypothetical protein VDGD_05304 [Verticillium dahliae]